MRTRCRGWWLPLLTGLALVCTAALPVVAGSGQGLVPRWVRPKPLHSQWRQDRHTNLVVLKFCEDSGVRLRNGLLVSLNGTPLQGLNQVFGDYDQPEVRRLFTRCESVLDQERTSGQLLSGRELADLNLYFLVEAAPGTDLSLLVDDLNDLEVVELAYFEPVVVQGAIHPAVPGDREGEGGNSVTPDFSDMQQYLDPAPHGLDARFAWEFPGGLGEGVRLGLVERGLNPYHEDLIQPKVWKGNYVELDHGTAVLGEILGQHNGFGVMGIAPEVELHVSQFDCEPPYPVIADAINALSSNLRAGDVMLIEYHAPGPESGEPCPCSCYCFEYLPLEYWQATFDAISAITANQVVCVEIAGNGSMDLDHPRYGGAFLRYVRDSGAILVGAAQPNNHKPTCWTNHGSRLDVHGHGFGIVTAGYGLLYNDGPDATYTAGFGGTSGAGAMTAGAVCSLLGWYQARTGTIMSPEELLMRLQWGTPPSTVERLIGPMPDLRTAICGPRPTISARSFVEGP